MLSTSSSETPAALRERRRDPPPSGGNLLVGLALQAPVELGLAVIREWKMRVRVDETRNGGAPRASKSQSMLERSFAVDVRIGSHEGERPSRNDDEALS